MRPRLPLLLCALCAACSPAPRLARPPAPGPVVRADTAAGKPARVSEWDFYARPPRR